MADVVEDLNTLHKEVFANGVPDLVPNSAKLQKELKFQQKELELGLKYVQTVRLSYPGGFTHAKADGTAGAFSLNDSKAGTQKRAEVTGSQIVLRDQLSYEDAAKASRGGAKAFEPALSFFYAGLQKAMRKRIETELLYGGASIGKILTYTGGDPSIVITLADWAPGIWSGMEGSEIDVHSGATSTVRGSVTVAGVDIENRKITLSGTVTGAAADDLVYFKGAYGNEMSGVYSCLVNAGSLFGISAATYSLWKSTSHAVTGALSFGAIKKAVAKAVSKGLEEDVTLWVNPGGWDDLMTDIASLRRTDKAEVKKVEMGAEELVYHSQNGAIRVMPHSYVKQGHALGMCMPYWKRIGAADVTFNVPGSGDKVFFDLASKAGIEARCYTLQSIFAEAPAKNFIITGIVNST